jgi:hypothetical protein
MRSGYAVKFQSGGRRHRARRRASGAPYTPRLVSKRPLGCLFEVVETLVLTIIIFLVIRTSSRSPIASSR